MNMCIMFAYLTTIPSRIYNYAYPQKQSKQTDDINIDTDLTKQEVASIEKIIREHYTKDNAPNKISHAGLRYCSNDIIEKLQSEQSNKYNLARKHMYENLIRALNNEDMILTDSLTSVLGSEMSKLVFIIEQLRVNEFVLSKIPLCVLLKIDRCLAKKYNSTIRFADYDNLLE